jgi:hypothetical protein
MSTEAHLLHGVTRAITPISSISASACSVAELANWAPEIARPGIPSSRRDRLGGDRVVAGDHPDLDAGRVGVRDRRLGPRVAAGRRSPRARAA